MVVSGRTATAHTSSLIRSTLRFAMGMAYTHRCDEKKPNDLSFSQRVAWDFESWNLL